MNLADQNRFPPLSTRLKDGRQVTLRALRSGDGPALADFYRQIPPADVFFYCPHPLTAEYALANAARADHPGEIVLVVDPGNGTIGGYAWIRRQPDLAAGCFGICLAASFKGQGLGEALIARLTEIARNIGPSIVQLTVQKKNAGAVALYRKMGFRVIREQLRNDGEPEYFMELNAARSA